jgi:hypothetical protein
MTEVSEILSKKFPVKLFIRYPFDIDRREANRHDGSIGWPAAQAFLQLYLDVMFLTDRARSDLRKVANAAGVKSAIFRISSCWYKPLNEL